MQVLFKGSNGKIKQIGCFESDRLTDVEAHNETYKILKAFCANHHFKIYYSRMSLYFEIVTIRSSTDTLVFVGDYIDRGYYSYETVELLIKLQRQVGKGKVICLKGNHELMGSNFDFDLWMYNGGHDTLESYERNGQDISIHKNWMRNLPLISDTPKIIFLPSRII